MGPAASSGRARGAVKLSGQNKYSGGTAIGAGTIIVGSGTALGGAANGIAIGGGGELDLDGYNLVAGTVTLTDGSIVDSVGGGSLTASAYVLMDGTISADLAGGTLNKLTSDTVLLSGSPTAIRASPRSTPAHRTRGRRRNARAHAYRSRADIQSGKIVFDYGPSGSDPATAIHGAMISGLIHSSTADVNHELGWADRTSTGNVTPSCTRSPATPTSTARWTTPI